MTFASALFFLGFTLLISLGVFALGLIFAASAFAVIAAAIDVCRWASRWARWTRRAWRNMGATGHAFVWAWGGFALCTLLAGADSLLTPRLTVGCNTVLDGFDLLGVALAFPAMAQIFDRAFGQKVA